MTFEPSSKDEVIEDMISTVMGKDRRATILSQGCMTCDKSLTCRTCNQVEAVCHGHPFMPFRDALSVREYSISSMCQACQDEVFGAEPEQDFL